MKKKIALVALFFPMFTTFAFAELTQTDLEKIQSIVDKSVEASEKRIKEYVDLKINALDAKLTGQINALDAKLTGQIKGLDAKLTGQIKGLDGRLTQIYGFVIALVALIAIAVGIPHILVARQGKEIRTQEQQIKALQQEIEKLKRDRMTGPE